ncbi:hypothetical protein [Rhodothalassium salexigens]|nr:hypothetical protein [Rhodothalassium salexigens]
MFTTQTATQSTAGQVTPPRPASLYSVRRSRRARRLQGRVGG